MPEALGVLHGRNVPLLGAEGVRISCVTAPQKSEARTANADN